MSDRLFDTGQDDDDGGGPGAVWCQCERRRPFARPDWDAWVSDRDRAVCRSCARDVRPADAKKAYAQACAAHAYYRWRFPGFGQQVPPPDKQAEQRPTDGQVRAFLRGEDVGSCDRCGGLEHVDTGTVVSKGEYERLCRGCWWRATRGVFEQVGIVWERDYVVPREGEVAST